MKNIFALVFLFAFLLAAPLSISAQTVYRSGLPTYNVDKTNYANISIDTSGGKWHKYEWNITTKKWVLRQAFNSPTAPPLSDYLVVKNNVNVDYGDPEMRWYKADGTIWRPNATATAYVLDGGGGGAPVTTDNVTTKLNGGGAIAADTSLVKGTPSSKLATGFDVAVALEAGFYNNYQPNLGKNGNVGVFGIGTDTLVVQQITSTKYMVKSWRSSTIPTSPFFTQLGTTYDATKAIVEYPINNGKSELSTWDNYLNKFTPIKDVVLNSFADLENYTGKAYRVKVDTLKRGGDFEFISLAKATLKGITAKDNGVIYNCAAELGFWIRTDTAIIKMSFYETADGKSFQSACKWGKEVWIDENTILQSPGGVEITNPVYVRGFKGKSISIAQNGTYGGDIIVTSENVVFSDLQIMQVDTISNAREFFIIGRKSNIKVENCYGVISKGLLNIESPLDSLYNINILKNKIIYKPKNQLGDNSIINVGSNVHGANIEKNDLYGNGAIGMGIQIQGVNFYPGSDNYIKNIIVKDNIIKNFGIYGINVYSNYPTPVDVVGKNRIFNVTIANNRVDSVWGGRTNIHTGTGIYLLAITELYVLNNTLYNCNLGTTGFSLVPAALGGSENHNCIIAGNIVNYTKMKGIGFTYCYDMTISDNRVENSEDQALFLANCKRINISKGNYKVNKLNGVRTAYFVDVDSIAVSGIYFETGHRGVGFKNNNKLSFTSNILDVKELTFNAHEGIDFVDCDTVDITNNKINQNGFNWAAIVIYNQTGVQKGKYNIGENTFNDNITVPYYTNGLFHRVTLPATTLPSQVDRVASTNVIIRQLPNINSLQLTTFTGTINGATNTPDQTVTMAGIVPGDVLTLNPTGGFPTGSGIEIRLLDVRSHPTLPNTVIYRLFNNGTNSFTGSIPLVLKKI
jgi:hypothetical protein